ncbi:hypothetical protein SGLAD_v1c08000 [Spiroplasma gladiatoris]|uniref:Uncharacterized protein n=1 Tax=Spiroplasma gladiatoris TaxID=2143 RepID=A0A4V1AQC3_9MOLU|nr:hypothetical protein [Spiroplasma gladiatoris]QBQ07999.1 hypothetical protein SGLAD_v1c08000 [Spiroplasma gladiatoris]
MKKWFKILFALNLNATPLNELYGVTQKRSSKYKDFLDNTEIDFYFKKDLSFKGTDDEAVMANLDNIVKDNFLDYEFGEKILNLTNYEFLEYKDYQLTLKFFDKEDQHCLGSYVTKTFDMWIYNYDNFEKMQKEIINKTKLFIPKTLVTLDQIIKYVDNFYQEQFNKIARKNMYLNDEKDFFNYLSFFEIDDNGNLKAEFLGSNILTIPLNQA